MRDEIVYDELAFSSYMESLSYNPDAQYFLSAQRLAAISRGEANLDAINALRASLRRKVFTRSRRVTLSAQQSAVKSLISAVTAQHGLDATYFHGLAHRESGFNPYAGAQTSSARGLWQFTVNTWLCSVRQYGAAYGLPEAAQIQIDRNGNCTVTDQSLRNRILSLRYNEAFSTQIVIAHTLENRSYLQGRGVAGNQADLYAVHFLGQTDGLRFLKARPYELGASILPRAAAANPTVFYAYSCASRHKCARTRPLQVWEIYSSFYSL